MTSEGREAGDRRRPVAIYVRPIAVDDARSYVDLLAWLYNESFYPVVNLIEGSMSAADWRAAITELLAGRERIILVAATSDEETGIASELAGFLSTTAGWSGSDRSDQIHNLRIVIGIREAYTGRGLGTRLFAALEAWARAAGVRRLDLTVETENKRALALYSKVGFLVENTIHNAIQIEGRWFDDYVMAKWLKP